MDAFLLERKSPHHNPPVTTKSRRMLVFRTEAKEIANNGVLCHNGDPKWMPYAPLQTPFLIPTRIGEA